MHLPLPLLVLHSLHFAWHLRLSLGQGLLLPSIGLLVLWPMRHFLVPVENPLFAGQIYSLLLQDFPEESDHCVIEKQVPGLLREHPRTQVLPLWPFPFRFVF